MQKVSFPPPPVTPVPPSVGGTSAPHQRQVDEPGLSPNDTLPSQCFSGMAGGIAVLTYVVFNSSPLKEV